MLVEVVKGLDQKTLAEINDQYIPRVGEILFIGSIPAEHVWRVCEVTYSYAITGKLAKIMIVVE